MWCEGYSELSSCSPGAHPLEGKKEDPRLNNAQGDGWVPCSCEGDDVPGEECHMAHGYCQGGLLCTQSSKMRTSQPHKAGTKPSQAERTDRPGDGKQFGQQVAMLVGRDAVIKQWWPLVIARLKDHLP